MTLRPVVLVFFLFLISFALAACDPFGFGSNRGDARPSLIEGEYDARYVVRFEDIEAPEGQDPSDEYRGELFCIFSGEDADWECWPRLGQPVTAGGSYELDSEELVLHDVNVKRANFILDLSPDGTYDYELDGDTLTLTQGNAGAPDYYPTREHHRIVLVRRDTSEYEYLSTSN